MNRRTSVNGFVVLRALPAMLPLMMIAAALTSLVSTASAQGEGARAVPYQAVIVEDKVPIRAGAGDAYYPFGELRAGDIITVAQERFSWARVPTRGRAFSRMFGYVHEKDIHRNVDGRTGITLGRVSVLAPNLLRDLAPESSWRPIGELHAEQTVTIREAVAADTGTFYRIALPDGCDGWIPTRFLRPATEAELIDWERRGRESSPDVAPATPEVGPQPPATRATDSERTTQESQPRSSDAAPPITTSTPPTPPATEADPPSTPTQTTIENDQVATGDSTGREAEAADAELPAPVATSPIEPLEEAYDRLRGVPIREAEIDELLERYRAVLATGELTERDTAIARARIELLDTRKTLQDRMRAIDELRNRADLSVETVEAARLQIELAAVYAAIGVVNPSTIYDGRRLPRMYRLTDPGSGRTIAYLGMSDQFDYLDMIGQVVGVVGRKSYDDGLRLNVITPTRIDLMTVRK